MERIKFKKNYQRKFISEVCKKSSLNLKQLSQKININYNTFKNYYQEKHLIPRDLVLVLSDFGKINKDTLPIEKIYPKNWGASKGGKKGIKTLLKKYKKEMPQWRRKGGKISGGNNKKNIRKPPIDESLAEFVGIYLGDGTLTKYFVRISGDSRYDLPYFKYLKNLVKKLFGIEPKISITKKDLLNLTISSKEVCDFLHKEMGLPYGDKIKNKTKIPHQILKNIILFNSCLRGLIDTDGFVGKSNNRLKVVFTSHNKTLLKQIVSLDQSLGYFNKFYGKSNLEISSKSKITNYLNTIGSSNLRHIIRIKENLDNGILLYKKQVPYYYDKYIKLKLPYHGPVV